MSLWNDRGGKARKGEGHVQALECIKQWTRERFALDALDTIIVSEGAPTLPGFPALETQVGFWTAGGNRHHFRVFKPAAEVLESDIPPAWMKKALAGASFDCECC
jgi:nitrate reductase delta subunit